MRRPVGIVGLLFAVVLTMGACGEGTGGDGDSGDQSGSSETEASTAETADSPRTLPEQGPFSAGKYRTEKFEPAFSFEVGGGWEAAAPEFPDLIGLARGEGFLGFAHPQKVFDPKSPEEQKEIPAPETVEEWVAWHRESPYLNISEPEPASVGGTSGVRFDLEVVSAPKNYPEGCGGPCVPAFPVGPTEIDFFLGDQEEDYVLEVGGEAVTVTISAPPDEPEEFRSEARTLLDTVEWKAGS